MSRTAEIVLAAEENVRRVPTADELEKGSSLWADAWARLKKNRLAMISLSFAITFLLGLAVAIYGGRRYGWFTPQRPPATVVQPAAAPAPAPLPMSVVAPDLAALAAREAAREASASCREHATEGDKS